MNIGITWGQFIAILAIGLIIYYAAILLHYLKGRLLNKGEAGAEGQPGVHKRVWSVAEKNDTTHDPDAAAIDEALLHGQEDDFDSREDDTEDERIFQSLELLAGEIEDTFADPAVNTSAGQLLTKLTERVHAYPMLTAPAFKNALVNLIARKATETGMPITRADALAIWDGDAHD